MPWWIVSSALTVPSGTPCELFRASKFVVNPGTIEHHVPGQRPRLPARAEFQRDGVLGFESVKHLAAVRARLHADGLVEGNRLETAAQVQVNQRLVVPLVGHAALRIERAELVVVRLVAERRGMVAVTENAVDVDRLKTREQGELFGQVELVLREQGKVEIIGPVREEERADFPVGVGVKGVGLRLEGREHSGGETVPVAKHGGGGFEENVRRVVVGIKAHRAEAEVVLVFVALLLLAVVPFQARLEGPVLALDGEAVDEAEVIPAGVPLLLDGLGVGLARVRVQVILVERGGVVLIEASVVEIETVSPSSRRAGNPG